jgi:hypothetical protein
MAQSKQRSLKEACINIAVGYLINLAANLTIFPLMGYHISFQDNIIIGIIFTVISLVRSYSIRRWFSKGD